MKKEEARTLPDEGLHRWGRCGGTETSWWLDLLVSNLSSSLSEDAVQALQRTWLESPLQGLSSNGWLPVLLVNKSCSLQLFWDGWAMWWVPELRPAWEIAPWEAVRKLLPRVMGGRLCVLIGGSPLYARGFFSGKRYFEFSEVLFLKSTIATWSPGCSWQLVSTVPSKVVMMSSTSELFPPLCASLLWCFW